MPSKNKTNQDITKKDLKDIILTISRAYILLGNILPDLQNRFSEEETNKFDSPNIRILKVLGMLSVLYTDIENIQLKRAFPYPKPKPYPTRGADKIHPLHTKIIYPFFPSEPT